MFVLANVVHAIAIILDRVLWLYSMVMLVAVLLTWVNPDPYNPIVRFLRAATEPVFGWIRRRLPFAVLGMLDLSPMLAFLGLWFIRMALVGSLLDLSVRLR